VKHDRLNSESIYRGRILDLSVDYFETADGKAAPIEVIHHNGGAGVLPVFDDGRIGLVKQWRYVLNKYCLEIPAGRIELNDTPEATAARELEEEFGFRSRSLEKLTEFYVAPGYCTEKIFLFLARGLEPSHQNPDEDEEIEAISLTLDDALAKVNEGVIDDSKTIIALLVASSRLRS